MSFCKNCGAKLNDEDKFCRACGTPVTSGQPKKSAGKKIIGGILGLLIAIALVFAGMAIAGYLNGDPGDGGTDRALSDNLPEENAENMHSSAYFSVQEEEVADPLLDLPVEKLRVKLEKGPSCMVANTFESYYPGNVIDGNRGTAWGRESYQGSQGTFVFNLPCRRLDHIDIWNGKWGEMGAWGDNARVKEMTISKRNKVGEVMEIGTFTLENKHDVQTLYFDFYAEETRDIETLTITVSGKYGGELFQDLYLSELEFYGSK